MTINKEQKKKKETRHERVKNQEKNDMISGFAKVTQCYYAGDLTNIFLITVISV